VILAILQARVSSTRLPGKVLLPILGQPMILRQIERIRRAARIDRLLVATSLDASDDGLAQTLADAGVQVFRGPLDDVLARFTAALDACPAEHVVRLTADCPLADPLVIDAVIARHREAGADYTNNLPPGAAFPKGQDVEVISADALRRAHAEATTPQEHEHVTWGPRHAPGRYRHASLAAPQDLGDVRWTVDRPDDFEFVTAVYEGLYPHKPAFTSDDIRGFVAANPHLSRHGGDRRL
jgi:spore coat polysaccharide biosynthesis protein SpsF